MTTNEHIIMITSVITGILLGVGVYTIFSNTTPPTPIRRTVSIERTADGYDVYEGSSLMYEFTRQNTDSLSLETLKMIYEGD